MPIVPQTHWKQYMHWGLSHTGWTKSKLNYVILLTHSHSNDDPVWTARAKIDRIKSLDEDDNTIFDCAGNVLKQRVHHLQLTYRYVTWPATTGFMLKQYFVLWLAGWEPKPKRRTRTLQLTYKQNNSSGKWPHVSGLHRHSLVFLLCRLTPLTKMDLRSIFLTCRKATTWAQ